MMKLCSDVLSALTGKTLVTAESCTGGGIGAALTGVSGASRIYKGGIISYSNEVKQKQLGVPAEMIARFGAVSEPVAAAMAEGARKLLNADIAISVTGLAGPDGDEYDHPVGTVYIGFSSTEKASVRSYCFSGDRKSVRQRAVVAALHMCLEECSNE